jgi:hypothetical protein
MQQLIRCPPWLMQDILVDLLKNRKSPLAREIRMSGSPVYGRILCWQLHRIGIPQIKSFIKMWKDPSPRAAFMVSTSGYTPDGIEYVNGMAIPIYLLGLEQLVTMYSPSLSSLAKGYRKIRVHNIKFLPELTSV